MYSRSRLYSLAVIACLSVVAVAESVATTCRALYRVAADLAVRAFTHVAATFEVTPEVKSGQLVERVQHLEYLARQVRRERVRKEASWCMASSI